MGALTLTLCDSNDQVIGTGAVPGIKRLSKNNSIREVSNIRDGNDGYRLGRLPVLINMTEAKASRSRSTSRSRHWWPFLPKNIVTNVDTCFFTVFFEIFDRFNLFIDKLRESCLCKKI